MDDQQKKKNKNEHAQSVLDSLLVATGAIITVHSLV